MCNYTLVYILEYLYVFIFYFLLNKGLIKVYTVRDIKHKNDRVQGIVNNNKGIVRLISYSSFVQLHNVVLVAVLLSRSVILSESVIFIIFIY